MAIRYWVGGDGTWDNSSTANWSATSGGAAGASAPVSGDTAIFDTASAVTTYVVTVAATAVTTACTVANPTSGTVTLRLSGSPVFNGQFTLTSGAVDLANNTLTIRDMLASNSNTRSIAFGTGRIVVTGNNRTVWNMNTATNFTFTGSGTVEASYAGATGTRNFSHGATSAGGTEANAISVLISAGTDIVSNDNNTTYTDFQFSNFTGTWTVAGGIFIYGNLILNTGMSVSSTVNSIFLANSSGIKTLTSNNVTINSPVRRQTAGGTTVLADDLTLSSARALTLNAGTFNANGKNVSVPSFALASGLTKVLTLGAGTWTVTGSGTSWDANTNNTGLTVSASTGTISMTSASAKTFAGGTQTWPTLNQGGTGALTIQQSNTFVNVTNTVQPATITLTSGTTQTVTDFDVSGTSGNLITLNASTPGSRATLTDSGGVNSVSFVDIKDIAATGYGEWQAYTSNGNVNSGNNVGWVFDAPPAFVASEYPPELRSFTEKRRF
jgi:hypothetical protein